MCPRHVSNQATTDILCFSAYREELDSNGPAGIYDALLAECEGGLGSLSIEDD